MAKVASKR